MILYRVRGLLLGGAGLLRWPGLDGKGRATRPAAEVDGAGLIFSTGPALDDGVPIAAPADRVDVFEPFATWRECQCAIMFAWMKKDCACQRLHV